MKKIFNAVLVLTLVLLPLPFVRAQTRGVTVKINTGQGQTKEIKLYDASYALVIGNSKYINGWDSLAGVASDVIAVSGILKQQGFVVETAENLTGEQFTVRVGKFIRDHGFEPNNRLLIYYAGHGHTLKSTGDGRELGYIVPVDAPLPKKDERGFIQTAIPMDDILGFAKKIQSKHALFIFDSCFSGKLVTRSAIVPPPVILENVAFPVRQFITAGAANQPVPDESYFRRSFVRGLEGEADRNLDGYITGTELAEYLKEKVTNYSNRAQTPLYAKINDVELDKGDFVFLSGTGSGSVPDGPYTGEATFWKTIENSTNVDDFMRYKQKYPGGIYIDAADQKIRKLNESVNTNLGSPSYVNVGIMNTRAISLVKPEYPAAAKKAKAKGEVVIQIYVDLNGNVTSAIAVSGPMILRPPAEAAARQSRFYPVKVGGVAVNARGTVVYNFINQ
jgi:TonB family protein